VEGNGRGVISGTFRHFTGGTDGSHKESVGMGNLLKTGHKHTAWRRLYDAEPRGEFCLKKQPYDRLYF